MINIAVAEKIWLPLIVIVSAAVSPMIMAMITNSNNRRMKLEDYARQDAVAEKAAEAAKLLLAANERVADTTKITNDKLDIIHTLVNSNMTAALQAELDAIVRELAMMLEVVELNRAAGREPSVEALAAIKSTKDRIAELKAILSDRVEQTKKADAQKAKQ